MVCLTVASICSGLSSWLNNRLLRSPTEPAGDRGVVSVGVHYHFFFNIFFPTTDLLHIYDLKYILTGRLANIEGFEPVRMGSTGHTPVSICI